MSNQYINTSTLKAHAKGMNGFKHCCYWQNCNGTAFFPAMICDKCLKRDKVMVEL